MSKKSKKKVGQFDHYKKWTTNQGYTFLAKSKEDALDYLTKQCNITHQRGGFCLQLKVNLRYRISSLFFLNFLKRLGRYW